MARRQVTFDRFKYVLLVIGRGNINLFEFRKNITADLLLIRQLAINFAACGTKRFSELLNCN